ncbi:MAG: DUF488 family protein [Acetobacteraceae bacterium]
MPELLTIGYEASTIAAVTEALRAAGATLLIDVRAVPQSRKPGFSRRLLEGAMTGAGIGYLHLQPLGTPKAGRDAVRAGHPEVMERIYRAHIVGDAPQAALAQARSLAAGQRACLLCFERDPAHCHRRLVAEMIAADTGQTIVHLTPTA